MFGGDGNRSLDISVQKVWKVGVADDGVDI